MNHHVDQRAKDDGLGHLGEDASARELARALDALGAMERAGAPVGMAERIARGSMPTSASGLRLAGAPRRPWAARMRPMLAMAAAVAVVAGVGVYFGTRPASAPDGPTLVDNTPSVPQIPTTTETTPEVLPQLAIAKATSDVETWLAVGEEMDALMSTTATDLSATASALEEKAMASFAADDWFSESSL